MRSSLPFFWLVITGVTILSAFLVHWPLFSETLPQRPLSVLPSIATGVLANLTVAVIYMLLLRTTSDRKVVVFGWIHAGSHLSAQAIYTWVSYVRNDWMASGELPEARAIALIAGLLTIVRMIAALSFLAAVFCAYRDHQRSIDIRQFD
ncbi:MAG: hypothetical protein AAFP91_17510 [Pseudomonadota bacterium]